MPLNHTVLYRKTFRFIEGSLFSHSTGDFFILAEDDYQIIAFSMYFVSYTFIKDDDDLLIAKSVEIHQSYQIFSLDSSRVSAFESLRFCPFDCNRIVSLLMAYHW